MSAADPLVRLEELVELQAPDPRRRRMLVIVNPYATTVSERLRSLVVYALQGRYAVDTVDTQRRGHATELCRQAGQEGYDVVVAFGGDGTVNEAANGLIGSRTPLIPLPGGRTNVFGRMLGIPADIVDATEHLLDLAHRWAPRHVDLGRLDERYFLFSAGIGLDASVVAEVDAHPRLKARLGEYYYAFTGVRTLHRRYLLHPPRFEVQIGDRRLSGVTAIVQNADTYTFFGDRPVHMGDGASLDSGDLAAVILQRATPIDVATVGWRALSSRARLLDHRRVQGFSGIRALMARSLDERELPLQVDGDYLGERHEVRFACCPRALPVVA